MDYQEFEVPESLRRKLACVWRLRDPDPSPDGDVVFPDGRCELIVHLGTPMACWQLDRGWVPQDPVMFAAQQRAPIRLAALGPLDCFGIRLQPAASALIPGVKLPALRERIIPLGDLDPGFALALSRTVRASSATESESRLWQLLESRLASPPLDESVEKSVAALDDACGQVRISDLAGMLGLPMRRLQARFQASVGLTPKEYSRVLRLQSAIRLIDADRAPLANIAVDVGFCDQAHATRELQSLTGLTPARLSKALREQRNGKQALKLAAAFVRGRSV